MEARECADGLTLTLQITTLLEKLRAETEAKEDAGEGGGGS